MILLRQTLSMTPVISLCLPNAMEHKNPALNDNRYYYPKTFPLSLSPGKT